MKIKALGNFTPVPVEKIYYYPVVELKNGVKLDLESGNGTFNNPYNLVK